MDLDFDIFFYCWGEFLKCSAGLYSTFLFINKIHPNIELRDQNQMFLHFSTQEYMSLIKTNRYIAIVFIFVFFRYYIPHMYEKHTPPLPQQINNQISFFKGVLCCFECNPSSVLGNGIGDGNFFSVKFLAIVYVHNLLVCCSHGK